MQWLTRSNLFIPLGTQGLPVYLYNPNKIVLNSTLALSNALTDYWALVVTVPCRENILKKDYRNNILFFILSICQLEIQIYAFSQAQKQEHS